MKYNIIFNKQVIPYKIVMKLVYFNRYFDKFYCHSFLENGFRLKEDLLFILETTEQLTDFTKKFDCIIQQNNIIIFV
jgi:hypothetical protein